VVIINYPENVQRFLPFFGFQFGFLM
jgi:hypothetical protein